MKFSQKIFIMAFTIIIVSMDIMGYLMIRSNYESMIENEEKTQITEHSIIRKNLNGFIKKQLTILTDASNSSSTTVDPPYVSTEAFKDSVIHFLNASIVPTRKGYLELYKEDNLVYSNLLEKPKDIVEKIKPTEENYLNTYLTTIEEKQLLFISSIIKLPDGTDYHIVTAKDVSYIYELRKQQIQSFIKISLIITLGVTIVLVIFVKFLTSRIKKLTAAISKVSKGEYTSGKVKEKGKDEIAILTHGYNEMIDSVNENVKHIEKIAENRKNFIGNITHEIRTPLTSIIGFSNLLKNVKIEKQSTVEEYASKIYEEGIYIKNISDKLRQITLLEENQILLEKINLSKEIEKIIESLKGQIPENIKLKEVIEPEVYQQVDKDLIKALLINLVNNSIKACGGQGNITVRLTKDGIQIKDNGKGIPQEEIEKIKEPFYTLDKSRNREVNHLGLGLPLCIKIAEVHEFTLNIESKIGEGTNIIIHFPKQGEKE